MHTRTIRRWENVCCIASAFLCSADELKYVWLHMHDAQHVKSEITIKRWRYIEWYVLCNGTPNWNMLKWLIHSYAVLYQVLKTKNFKRCFRLLGNCIFISNMIILMKGYGLENGFLCVFPFANYLWLILTGFMTSKYFKVIDFC